MLVLYYILVMLMSTQLCGSTTVVDTQASASASVVAAPRVFAADPQRIEDTERASLNLEGIADPTIRGKALEKFMEVDPNVREELALALCLLQNNVAAWENAIQFCTTSDPHDIAEIESVSLVLESIGSLRKQATAEVIAVRRGFREDTAEAWLVLESIGSLQRQAMREVGIVQPGFRRDTAKAWEGLNSIKDHDLRGTIMGEAMTAEPGSRENTVWEWARIILSRNLVGHPLVRRQVKETVKASGLQYKGELVRAWIVLKDIFSPVRKQLNLDIRKKVDPSTEKQALDAVMGAEPGHKEDMAKAWFELSIIPTKRAIEAVMHAEPGYREDMAKAWRQLGHMCGQSRYEEAIQAVMAAAPGCREATAKA